MTSASDSDTPETSAGAATRCGTVSIAGRPNVGKSTLINRLLGQKLSITAHKPQTTRHSILGIKTIDEVQMIIVDTPGIHVGGAKALNSVLNRTASSALLGVDAIVFIVQAGVWTKDDERAYELVLRADVPFYIAVNKVDTIKQKNELLPFLQRLPTNENLQQVFIISARRGDGVDSLEAALLTHLPEAPFEYDADEFTNRSSRFLAAEMVREQLTRFLSEELPYALTVEIETFEETPALYRIGAVIWVEKDSQKGIVIGKGGERLKEIGQRSRQQMQNLFGTRVFLELWVRVKEGWADDERALRSLGLDGS